MTEFELGILSFIQDKFGCAFLDKAAPVISYFGDKGIFWISLTVLFLLFRKTRPLGFSMAIALSLGFIFGNMVIKNVVARTRPYDAYNGEITLLVKKLSDYSFPSGHTLASFEGATCIFIRYKKWGIAALTLAFLIALSRLYLFVHYPSDILAGMILGITFAIIGTLIINRIYKRRDTLSKKSNID